MHGHLGQRLMILLPRGLQQPWTLWLRPHHCPSKLPKGTTCPCRTVSGCVMSLDSYKSLASRPIWCTESFDILHSSQAKLSIKIVACTEAALRQSWLADCSFQSLGHLDSWQELCLIGLLKLIIFVQRQVIVVHAGSPPLIVHKIYQAAANPAVGTEAGVQQAGPRFSLGRLKAP